MLLVCDVWLGISEVYEAVVMQHPLGFKENNE